MSFVSNNWDNLWWNKTTSVSPTSEWKTATLVHKTERETDSYGEYMQGEGEIFMIFEVDGRYFKKTGYQSSYGDDRTWDGPVTEVKKVVKTVEVFE